MFLKSLSMKGFKSFADPTVLEFEPGITVVVGPNGSGKSNVVDAVTWVLGAQGPRSLRSQKMEDVIFAGTSSRPALGRAEVTLTIDNASGKLPVDLAEVTITRTLFRSGDSEYAINGAPCRLLDIQDLLSDSGVGRQQHMIIGQGQLDTVLNARPEDHRAIIEEAAGVLKHRRRRERAERRLSATAENLERLGDLVPRGAPPDPSPRTPGRRGPIARDHGQRIVEHPALSRRARTGRADRPPTKRSVRHGDLSRRRTRAARGAGPPRVRSHLDHRRVVRHGARRTWPVPWPGCKDSSSGPVACLACCGSGRSAVVVALDAAADVDVVSTLEAEASRLAAEMAEAAAAAATLAPERAEAAADQRALEVAEAELRARRREVIGDDTPDEAARLLAARRRVCARRGPA